MTLGAVNTCGLHAILFATVKGAHDMSLKSFLLRLLLCISALLCAVPLVHTQLFPIARGGGVPRGAGRRVGGRGGGRGAEPAEATAVAFVLPDTGLLRVSLGPNTQVMSRRTQSDGAGPY